MLPDRELIERVRAVPFAERVRRFNAGESDLSGITEEQREQLRALLMEKYGKDGVLTIGGPRA